MTDPGVAPKFEAGIAGAALCLVLGGAGLVSFNLGYVELYQAFLPLLCIGVLLRVEVGQDWFLSLLLFAVTTALVYTVGLFALPLLLVGILISVPFAYLVRRWGMDVVPATVGDDVRPVRRVLELIALLQAALFARYLVYRSSGGQIPISLGEFETLARFVMSEASGWTVFALGYAAQHRVRYGTLYTAGLDFAGSFPTLLATGLLLITPSVAIMTLGVNAFGIPGLYLSALPVGAAHVLMRTLTRRREEIERQNVRLQRLNVDMARSERMAAIGQMSSTISHQILQKIGLLGLQCDLLRDSLDETHRPTFDTPAEENGADVRGDEWRDDARRRVEQLDASITDLNATLSDLLVFSREFAVHRESGSLTGLLREAGNEVGDAAHARGVSLRYEFDGRGETSFTFDHIKLKQAVLNLLTNALDASPRGGTVTVSAHEADGRVRITVRDTGHGIPDEMREQIFSPFVSTKKTGSGLGLAFTQKIVELHGGTVSVRNNAGGGASLVLDLPLAERSA